MLYLAKPTFTHQEIKAVTTVLQSGMVSQGSQTEAFEKQFALQTESSYAVAVNSGTAAVHLALRAAGVGEGDEVITTPFTFIGTVNPILMVGAIPVFVDISADDYTIDPAQIEQAITPATKAIVTVDLFGQLCDYASIQRIAKKHGLTVIQDACQAIGAVCNEGTAGNLGDISAFSLYATKSITTGEGGVITTHNRSYATTCAQLRNHAMNDSYTYEYTDVGYNYRFNDIAAAIGIAQLAKLSRYLQTRRSNATLYNQALKDLPMITIPQETRSNYHTFSQYCIRVSHNGADRRDQLQKILMENDIQTKVYYPKLLSSYPHIAANSRTVSTPVAAEVCQEVLALPVHQGVTQSDIHRIATIIRSVVNA